MTPDILEANVSCVCIPKTYFYENCWNLPSCFSSEQQQNLQSSVDPQFTDDKNGVYSQIPWKSLISITFLYGLITGLGILGIEETLIIVVWPM